MRTRLIVLALAGLAVGAAVALIVLPGGLQRLASGTTLTSIGKATVGGPFSLIDHHGQRVSDEDFRGRLMLVYFGFTYCPDVCPTGLQVMAAAIEKLGPKGEDVVPILITVDPERDTPEALARYVPSFHPRLIGLTGSSAEIATVARAYRVYYRKVKDEASSQTYTVDHTSIVYLMGRDGQFVTHFTHATPPDAMAAAIAKAL
ncbi:MAG TPA: SCO family protein [Hyphomicrobiaceae bacterium]|nr:SCO family protein [Hyphomicrobiaceae bacterium]